MDEKDYELLHALDETRNITHAADKLYMTQSALSKRIKALEQELGVEIVLRSRQGIRFTPAGEQVLLHSAAAAREMEKMRRQLASIQGEACGTLRAGISVNFSYYRLPEMPQPTASLSPITVSRTCLEATVTSTAQRFWAIAPTNGANWS